MQATTDKEDMITLTFDPTKACFLYGDAVLRFMVWAKLQAHNNPPTQRREHVVAAKLCKEWGAAVTASFVKEARKYLGKRSRKDKDRDTSGAQSE